MNLLQSLKPAFQTTQCSVLLGWGKQENGTGCAQSVNTNTRAIISCAVITNCTHYPPAGELCHCAVCSVCLEFKAYQLLFLFTIKGLKSKQRSHFPCLNNWIFEVNSCNNRLHQNLNIIIEMHSQRLWKFLLWLSGRYICCTETSVTG